MLAAIHFAVLVVLPVWAGYAIRRRYEPPTSPRMMAAIAFGGAAGLIGVSQMHLCHEGTPLAQWMLPGATASLSMLFVQSRPLRRTIAFVSIVAALGLSTSFTSAVHGTTYTGNPAMNPGARSEWHSFLTGLYRRALIARRSQGRSRLEWRGDDAFDRSGRHRALDHLGAVEQTLV